MAEDESTKFEILNPKQCRITRIQVIKTKPWYSLLSNFENLGPFLILRHLCFDFVSNFVLGISNFLATKP
jgi:hypothetical protein